VLAQTFRHERPSSLAHPFQLVRLYRLCGTHTASGDAAADL
jgi:hypothetical protein